MFENRVRHVDLQANCEGSKSDLTSFSKGRVTCANGPKTTPPPSGPWLRLFLNRGERTRWKDDERDRTDGNCELRQATVKEWSRICTTETTQECGRKKKTCRDVK
ncbi:hypothetical protein JOB18_019199 [Solea senegalensis]|uniref:Uncharacterized protein n=1 Tax=Solea senegalensis TaxID=28829 RepID=A0AAV6P9P0_SOLSE|nr:hypothetical protein JOB18_019199 [Solea senegalensis]